MWLDFIGNSGAPIVIGDDHWTQRPPEDYLLVGIVSFANASSLNQSGIGCIGIGSIRDWIDSVTSGKVFGHRQQ